MPAKTSYRCGFDSRVGSFLNHLDCSCTTNASLMLPFSAHLPIQLWHTSLSSFVAEQISPFTWTGVVVVSQHRRAVLAMGTDPKMWLLGRILSANALRECQIRLEPITLLKDFLRTCNCRSYATHKCTIYWCNAMTCNIHIYIHIYIYM